MSTSIPSSPPPQAHEPIVREAMLKHDADLAAFYNALADMLE